MAPLGGGIRQCICVLFSLSFCRYDICGKYLSK